MSKRKPINALDNEMPTKVVEEKKSSTVTGKVVDCEAVHLRKQPTIISDSVVVLQKHAEVEVDISFKNEKWYKVKTATGDNGFIMKSFIAVKE